MNAGQLPTNQLHDINWDELDHAPQLLSCSYYVYICVYACVCVCMHVHVCVRVYWCVRMFVGSCLATMGNLPATGRG